MKAALFEKPGFLRVISKDLRRLQADEVLVRVDACGICGTDIHIVEGTSRSVPPVILGHEYSGVVEDAGTATNAKEGSRVAIDPNISCGKCFYCRRGLVHLCSQLRALGVDLDGGMANFSIVPAGQLHLLADDLGPDEGALIEPVSCAIHGIDRVRMQPGDTVVVLGAGTVGLIMLQLVRHAGAALTIVVEPHPHKREIARRLGADFVLDPGVDNVRTLVHEYTQVGADIVIECVGKPETMSLSLDLARRGGTVEFFGVCSIGATIPLEPNTIYANELTVVGSYVNPHTFSRAASLLRAHMVQAKPLEIQHFPLDGVQEAFAALREGRTLKSMIHPAL